VSEDGGITAEVSWTPRGTAALAARDYRYLSPEFEFDAAGNITEIVGAALTNDPNFPQLALNHQGDEPELPVTLKAIAEALGLNPAADEASVLTAINSLKAENQTALNAAQHPDPTRFVPAEQHQVALNAKQAAETELATLKGTQRETEITQAVDEALKAGKIVPANRNYYLAMCRTEGGLEQFRQFAANAPVIGDPSAVTPSSEQDKATGLTPAEVALCAQCGISHEQYLKARDA
jgi:phage I-like protein